MVLPKIVISLISLTDGIKNLMFNNVSYFTKKTVVGLDLVEFGVKRKLIIVGVLVLMAMAGAKIFFQPVAVVVPHHDVVAEKRSELLSKIAKKRWLTKTIVIIGPDHFSPFQKQISFAETKWNLSNGEIEFDNRWKEDLEKVAEKRNGLMKNDHAIFNLLTDIKKLWPKAKIVPILIGQKKGDLKGLERVLKDKCGFDCLLVASVDFSHYLPYTLADIHDDESIDALARLDGEKLLKMEVDSPQSLWLMASLAEKKKAKRWHFFWRSNSSKMAGLPEAEGTSHVMGWYGRGKMRESKDPETFLVIKDKENKEYLGERFFWGTDEVLDKWPEEIKLDREIDWEKEAVAGEIKDGETKLIFLP